MSQKRPPDTMLAVMPSNKKARNELAVLTNKDKQLLEAVSRTNPLS